MCRWTTSRDFCCGHPVHTHRFRGEKIRLVRPSPCPLAQESGNPCQQTVPALQVQVPVLCRICEESAEASTEYVANALINDSMERYQVGLSSLGERNIELTESLQRLSDLADSYEAAGDTYDGVMVLFRQLRPEILREWNGDMPPDSSESDSYDDDDGDDSDEYDERLGVADIAGSAAASSDGDDQSSAPNTPYTRPAAVTGPPIRVYAETLQHSLARHREMRETIDRLQKQVDTLEAALARRSQPSSSTKTPLLPSPDKSSNSPASSELSETPTHSPQLPTPPPDSPRRSRFREEGFFEEELVDESLGQDPRINTQPHSHALLDAVRRSQQQNLRTRNRSFPAKFFRSLFRR